MEFLTFPLLTLEFLKHQPEINSRGFQIEFRSSSNIFQDQLLFSKNSGGKTFQFLIQHRMWDRYKEFSVNLGSPLVNHMGSYLGHGNHLSQWHNFRLNPLSPQPIQVNYGANSGLNAYNLWLNQDFGGELRDFSEEVLRMINHLIEKIQIDKVTLDSSEVS